VVIAAGVAALVFVGWLRAALVAERHYNNHSNFNHGEKEEEQGAGNGQVRTHCQGHGCRLEA
jgi:hypothetical protein